MISVNDLKAWLGITGSTYDTVLEALETRAVAWLEEQTGRYFGPIESPVYTEVLPGSGTRDLWLSEPPGALPDSVEETTYPGASATTITASAANGYELRVSGHEARLVRKGAYVWTAGYEYAVEFERGYASGDEPGDIQQAVYDLVRIAYKARETAGAGGIISETIGNYSYRLSDAAASSDPATRAAAFDIAATITHWRRPVLA